VGKTTETCATIVRKGRVNEVKRRPELQMSRRNSLWRDVFEARQIAPSYQDQGDEIDAVQSGLKKISLVTFGAATNSTRDALVDRAVDLGLVVSVVRGGAAPDSETCVFVCRQEEMWRIRALLALRSVLLEAKAPWSLGLEHLESVLLGYPAQDTAAYLQYLDDQSPCISGYSVFLIVTNACLRRVKALGMKAIDPDLSDNVDILFFKNMLLNREKAKAALVPGEFLLRSAVKVPVLKVLFGADVFARPSGRLLSMSLDSTMISVLNSGLECRFQCLEDGRWH